MKTEKNKDNAFLSSLIRIVDPRVFPMDLGRFFCFVGILLLRPKKVDVRGEKLSKRFRGAAVFAPNHTGFSDPLSIVLAFWYRRVFFLASEATMAGGLKKVLLGGLGCIKVDRNISDIEAVHKVRGVLSKGRIVTVFPQGHLESAENGVGRLKSGAVLMALQSGVPIVPIYSEKRKHFYERRLFVVGDAIDPRQYVKGRFPSMEDIEKVTDVLADGMELCRTQYLKIKESR